ncbi:hypothetical protein H310_05537 [Aphanomyces invadans]|uniref:Tubulin/FtsZ GTPase domain-containing protein n=1 Tax=Aphanomyces invadans TaxID=157072 RepID=A0A024UBU6_9STRA|nr:hypothetical protein H310_05537 [Aphanomyces invadans]ETW03113.1 hypothetical protein H310_05537 [Aphanomyces invadans]|eukprot:XP_008868497.1 hypothetical protein H310_05537 [Aphanomyces invadans]
MPRELITIQVGQCGNQIGRQFWKMALDEHAHHAKDATFDESMSTFFRNVDKQGHELPVHEAIASLRARAILVDMEEGPVSETLKGPLGELFDSSQFVTDVSGSGNNWAHGHAMYGPQYKEQLLEKLRHATELCDSLQSFFVLHSMGGGTGSGLGTYILGLLEDHYPDAFRFTTAIFPSADDDVITSPYNSMLALRELTDHADCVLPIENEALYDMLEKQPPQSAPKETAFDKMNAIVARTLTHLTSSMRFDGSLNVDLNEITTNLVPFPKLHYLLSSVAPLWPDKLPRRVNQMFVDAFQRDYQLIKTNPKGGTMLACGLLLRGNVQVSDIQANIQRIQSELRMIPWNVDGFKVGLCSVPALGHPVSLLTLSNNSCIVDTFERMQMRFQKLFKRKAHVHHYLDYMDASLFDEALENARWLIGEYHKLHDTVDMSVVSRPKPLF